MNILFVASEAVPFAKTGGLADVAGILPRIMAKTETVSLFIPDYQTESIERTAALIVDRFLVKIGKRNFPALIKRKNVGKNFFIFFVTQDLFFSRKFLYGDSSGDYLDNFYRFLFFQLAIVEFVKRNKMSFDIVQLNDWQTALIPLILKLQAVEPELKRAITFLTIHNLGYQGVFDSFYFKEIGLPDYLFSPEYLEFYGGINFLKGGIVFADHLLTVSPTYAKEIMTPEMGFGLDGLLKRYAFKLSGILNGVDYSLWDPRRDPLIFRRYSPASLSRKKKNKIRIFEEFGISYDARRPLVVVITRLAVQKGIELLFEAFSELMKEDLFLMILGTGDRIFEEKLKKLAASFKIKMKFFNFFDEKMAHRLEAAADILLMPSLYEPCGLNQMYSLKYGTVPVVRATGGLDDTVEDFDKITRTGTGFKFREIDRNCFLSAVYRALELYPDKENWETIQRNGMSADFSWDRAAGEYVTLYKKMLAQE